MNDIGKNKLSPLLSLFIYFTFLDTILRGIELWIYIRNFTKRRSV